ncbi:MAG: hypothetical protein QFB87_05260 [Patescibacteria group bacterium]|nr:hypothetical protein [Patescibacteria group bacterium]
MKRWLVAGGIVVVLGSAGGGLYLHAKASGALPKAVTKQVSFTLYYPTQLPRGYTLNKTTARVENDILFYSLKSGSKEVRVSEQAAPTRPPDLNSIPGFKKLESIAGNAAIGKNAGAPTALLITNTTLITISGTATVPQDVIVRLTQQMTSLET